MHHPPPPCWSFTPEKPRVLEINTKIENLFGNVYVLVYKALMILLFGLQAVVKGPEDVHNVIM